VPLHPSIGHDGEYQGDRPDIDVRLSYPCATVPGMVVRKKRSISMPPDLNSDIEAAATSEGMSYSGWLAGMARREFTIRAGLDAVSDFERAHGRFTSDEVAEAEAWASEALARGKLTGEPRRKSA